MQARENTSYSVTDYELNHLTHPNDGYKSETGGRMLNLRDSCSHKKVADYHKDFYRPDGVCLVVVGDVDPEELHQVVDKFLEKDKVVLFPSEDESTGIVRFAWSGFGYGEDDFLKSTALDLLLTYLTDTSVAELQKEFVECEDPLASGVYPYVEQWSPSQVTLIFDSVPMEKLQEVKPKLFKLFQGIVDGTSAIDMARMSSVMKRSKLEILNK
eukprot:gene15016-17747_t